jgi:hypothetical protein
MITIQTGYPFSFGFSTQKLTFLIIIFKHTVSHFPYDEFWTISSIEFFPMRFWQNL